MRGKLTLNGATGSINATYVAHDLANNGRERVHATYCGTISDKVQSIVLGNIFTNNLYLGHTVSVKRH